MGKVKKIVSNQSRERLMKVDRTQNMSYIDTTLNSVIKCVKENNGDLDSVYFDHSIDFYSGSCVLFFTFSSPETDEEWTRRLKEIHEELRRNKAEASEKARTARELAHRKNMIKRKEEKDLAEYERLKAKFEAGVKADDHCLG